MQIRSTRGADAVRLRHTAGFHRSDSDLLAQLTPIVAAAMVRGEPVASALRPETERALTVALAKSGVEGATRLVPLAGPDPHDASAQTLAGRRARELRELTTAAGAVTVVSEHWSRFDGADGLFWTELDAAANVALAGLPVDLVCFFPDVPLHQTVTQGALRNHPTLQRSGITRANPEHLPPHDVVRATPVPAPVLLGAPDVRRRFGVWTLSEVRALVERELLAAGFARDRAEDVVLAVNEIATNAVEHGTRVAEITLWSAGAPGGFVVEIQDGGILGDPLPGLVAPQPGDLRGRGVWIARQLCDSLHVWCDDSGTHVRIRAAP